jgi:hypothetical protein
MPAEEPADPSRRQFAKAMALLAATAPLLPACGSGRLALPATVPEPDTPLLPRLDDAEPQPVAPETELLFQLVRHRYGASLSPEQLEVVKKDIDAVRSAAARLRRVPLGPDDPPAAIFRAYRGGK